MRQALVLLILINLLCLNPSESSERELTQFAQSLQATVDIHHDLQSVLEANQIKNACQRHFKRIDSDSEKLPSYLQNDPVAVADMVRCGKWLFFSGDMPSDVAFPENLVKSGLKILKKETGVALTQYGMIQNPNQPELPIGITQAQGNPWGVLGLFTGKPMTITCAACHFGQLGDGRYAVGKTNDALEFGKVNAFLVFATWLANNKKFDKSIWPANIQEHYKKLDRLVKRNFSFSRSLFDAVRLIAWLNFSDSFYKLVNFSLPTPAELLTYTDTKAGVSYASSPLLPATRRVDGQLKASSYLLSSPSMWDIENYDGDVRAGKTRPLSAFIPTDSLYDFVAAAYVFQTGREDYSTPKFIDPLMLYMRTLKTPKKLQASASQSSIDQGQIIFSQQCQSCHNGQDGESLQAYGADLLGTPEVLIDPFVNYEPIHELSDRAYRAYLNVVGPLEARGGIYSRKLKGAFFRKNFFANGSADDLQHVFCLSRNRGTLDRNSPASDHVHLDLCRDYNTEEKRQLINFLEAWN